MKIICLGDSLTFGYGIKRKEVWTELLASLNDIDVINKGICGDTTAGMLSRFQKDVVECRPSHVIIMGGTNDFIFGLPLSYIKANIAAIYYESIHYGITPIIGVPIPFIDKIAPEYWDGISKLSKINKDIQRYRRWIIEFSKINKTRIFDFYKLFYDFDNDDFRYEYFLDGVHLNAEGNKIMLDEIKL